MATDLTTQDRIEIRFALEALNADFTYFLDHNDVDALVDLFCEDAIYTHGSRTSNGRAEIDALFRRRSSTRVRTARHLYSGLRLDIRSREAATGTSVCLTFAADGPPPHPPNPLLVADFSDVYAICSDGRWRFRERHIKRIFVDPAHPDPVGLQK